MSRGVRQEHPQTEGIFTAYSKQPRPRSKRMLLLYPAAVLLILVLGRWFVSIRQEATPIRVDTAWGLRTVRKGMSPQEVSGVLGQPTSKERRGNQECFQYGRPSIKVPSFVLHVVCYQDGKLLEVSEKRYNSWVVTQDMAISPAPLEYELEYEEEPAVPASPVEPGLASENPP